MTFLPIVVRELRLASRRRGTYWMRTTLGFAVSIVWLFLLATARRGAAPGQMGQVLFTAISVLAFGFGLLAGVFLTADCLSEERREGTLGLLFLTDLRGYDVVLGKLMATSMPALYGLLTVVPVLALPLLMGGVSVGEFWRVVLVLIATLILSLSFGLAVSACSRDARQAMSATLFILVLLTGILPLAGWVLHWLLKKPLWSVFFWPSAGYLYSRAFDSYYRWRGGIEFWGGLATVAGLAFVALAAANLRLPRAWREGREGRMQRSLGGWLRRLRFGSEPFRAARHRLLEQNPFYWLTTRDRMPPWVAGAVPGMLFLIQLSLFIGCFSGNTSTKDMSFGMSMLTAIVLHLVLKWLVAVEASRRFSEDRLSGALELLLVTPLPVDKILEGQRRALWVTFVFPTILALLANFGLFLLFIEPNPLRMGPQDRAVFCELVLGGVVVLLADIYALSWVGMWMGLRARRHHRAILGTLGRVMLAPWLVLLFFWFLGTSGALGGPNEAFFIFLLWHGFGLAIDIVFATRANAELRLGLRPTRLLGSPRYSAFAAPLVASSPEI
jgi:ABC-type transport system involved in cytochrome c biogenesis permease component